MDPLIDNLHRVHHIITRALKVSRTAAETFSRDGLPDADRKGFVDYVRCLGVQVHSHHDSEEQFLFPKLKPAADAATMATLQSQHHDLVEALNQLTDATQQADKGAPATAWLSKMAAALEAIEPRWTEHITLEEKTASQQLLDRAMSRPEQGALTKEIAEHSQKTGPQPPQLGIAFALYNLAGADREGFSKLMPPPLLGLMNGPWRAEWAPMQPYLLP
jgi:hemerythrin-like domain-containing protein